MKVSQVVGAVVGTIAAVIAVNVVGNLVFGLATPNGSRAMPIKTAYAAVPPAGGAGGATAVADAGPPDPVKLTAICKTCHSLDKGGANKVGPALWGVVGRPVASMAGFGYSDAVKKLGGAWTEERLDQWLTSPKNFAPGTKMSFQGYADPAQRKAVIGLLVSMK